ncbi:MAG: PadR family transcriptional regulator [Promethearchaeota archaeon]
MTETQDIKIQSITRFYILLLLKSKNRLTGYKIINRLKEDLGTTASPTSIYDFLKTLKESGYIEDIQKKNTGRVKGIRLTSTGDEFIDRIFSRFNNLIEAAVESKLKICASCGVKLYDNYHTEVIEGKEMNFCCKHCAKAFKNSFEKH